MWGGSDRNLTMLMTVTRHHTTASADPERAGENGIDLNSTVGAMASIRTLLAATRLRDPALADHGLRAAHIAAAVAEQLGARGAEVEHAYLGALLHDIGKFGVHEAILWKPTTLDDDEWTHMRTHPETGHQLIAELVHSDVASAVLHHHERLDGAGYPFGVRSSSLPETVRIVQVADAFDAITSDRPYEGARPVASALAEIRRCATTQFDPAIVDALQALFDGTSEDVVHLFSLETPPDLSLLLP